jgi:hypothetical protein
MVRVRLGVGLLLLAALTGCGDPNQPKLVPVKGVVTLDGQPLSGAVVTFMPGATTPAGGGSGRTGKDGSYKLTFLRGGTGVPSGEYKVVISKLVLPDGKEVPANTTKSPLELQATETLPPRYSMPDQSTLGVNVLEAGGTFDFPLQKNP